MGQIQRLHIWGNKRYAAKGRLKLKRYVDGTNPLIPEHMVYTYSI